MERMEPEQREMSRKKTDIWAVAKFDSIYFSQWHWLFICYEIKLLYVAGISLTGIKMYAWHVNKTNICGFSGRYHHITCMCNGGSGLVFIYSYFP